MLRDITIGQYYPADSGVHKLDPRVKIVAVFIYLVSLFCIHGFAGYVVVGVSLIAVVVMSKIPLSYIVRGLKPVVFLICFTAFFSLFFVEGDVVFHWRFIVITWQGLRKAVFMVLRLIFLVIGSSLLTYTTTPNQLTDGIEKLLNPLNRICVPVHELALMMSLALRFIPILLEEANRIIRAQSARGADFEEGNLFQKIRVMVSILVPLLVSSTRRAYDLALAMEARCYRGGKGRTKMKPLVYKSWDKVAYFVCLVYAAVLFTVDWLVPF